MRVPIFVIFMAIYIQIPESLKREKQAKVAKATQEAEQRVQVLLFVCIYFSLVIDLILVLLILLGDLIKRIF